MSEEPERNLEQQLRRSLHHAAPLPAPDLADRLLRQSAAVEQRRGWSGLALLPALGAAAVVVIAVVAGVAFAGLLPRIDPPGVAPSTPPVSAAASPTPTLEPASTPTQTPAPTPPPSPTPSAEVFPGGSECENESLGYTVSYPAGWYANDAVDPNDPALDPIAACQYFGDEPMELAPNAGVPPTVAISFSREDEVPPTSSGPTIVSERSITVAGQPAIVRETEQETDSGFSPAGTRSYTFYIELPAGDFLRATTSSTANGNYEDHTEVLDLMMDTLELIGS